MPRGTTRPPAKVEPAPPNSLIASAASVTRDLLAPKQRGHASWQREAWAFFDTCGELRQAANWLGNALSRVKLTVRRRTAEGSERVSDGVAAEALDALFGGPTGQAQMMSTLGVHLTVPGESYLIAEPNGQNNPDSWMVVSNDEIRTLAQKTWQVDREGWRDLSGSALIIRIWRSHAARYIEADSSVRAVLPILREIEQLTKHVAATIDSRLAGAGMLLLPSEMTFATPSPEGLATDPDQDMFLVQLTKAMVTPIADRSSAAAVVPIVVRAPGAVLNSAQHISFSTPFDAQSQSLREEAIKRLALGMDLPPEIMLGQGQSNHWSAWQTDEAAIKIHVEPLAELICDAITQKYIWPVLEAANEPDYDLYIAGDTSDLRVRPNHATEAIELYDRGQLSPDALRRETGFDESDAPNPKERAEVLLLKLALANSDLSPGAVRALGLEIMPEDVGTRWQPVPPPQVETPTGRDRALPERDDQAAALVAAAELIVLRALERANNRINRRGHQRRSCTQVEVDDALAGAWVQVPWVARQLGLDCESLQAQLDGYVRQVLTTGEQHTPERLRDVVMPRLELVAHG